MKTPQEKLISFIKHYRVFTGSLVTGFIAVFLSFGLENPVIPKGWATAFVFILMIGNIIYDYKRNAACSKCGKWTDIKQTDRIEKGGMLMPNGVASMHKFKCYNCGHTWTEFYKEQKHRH